MLQGGVSADHSLAARSYRMLLNQYLVKCLPWQRPWRMPHFHSQMCKLHVHGWMI